MYLWTQPTVLFPWSRDIDPSTEDMKKNWGPQKRKKIFLDRRAYLIFGPVIVPSKLAPLHMGRQNRCLQSVQVHKRNFFFKEKSYTRNALRHLRVCPTLSWENIWQSQSANFARSLLHVPIVVVVVRLWEPFQSVELMWNLRLQKQNEHMCTRLSACLCRYLRLLSGNAFLIQRRGHAWDDLYDEKIWQKF